MRKLLLVAMLVGIVFLAIEVIERIPAASSTVAAGINDENVMALTFGDAPEAGRVEGVDYHVVKDGETLDSLAEHYFRDAALAGDLAAFNGLLPPYEIVPGQVLDLR